MTSSFTWLDHSDRERQRVLDAIDRFKETDTRDELGLGSIRDSFAELFFPGTSVIQTRARYFLFVPWMYMDLERRRVSAAEMEARARKAETRLIQVLKSSPDSSGTLGSRAGDTLKRLPSNVYWLGLRTWKLRLFPGSQDDYHRSIDRFHAVQADIRRDDDNELVGAGLRRNWQADIPEAAPGFPTEASFALTREEARYLVDRIQLSAPGSLLAFLARHGRPADVAFAWEHPQLAAMPNDVRDSLDHARLLAETMQGAAWLYNVLLAEERAKATGDQEPVDRFRARLASWAAEVSLRQHDVDAWDRRGFWHLVRRTGRVSRSTESFVENWVRLTPWQMAAGGGDNAAARGLVRQRELTLKGNRARLKNPEALERWGGESGTARLDYRWRSASRLFDDIYAALGRKGNDAATR